MKVGEQGICLALPQKYWLCELDFRTSVRYNLL